MIRDYVDTYLVFFFQAEDGIRYLVRSRGLGDVYKRQEKVHAESFEHIVDVLRSNCRIPGVVEMRREETQACLLYTSDAADERSSVDLGGRRIIKKKKQRVTLRGVAQSTHNRKHGPS